MLAIIILEFLVIIGLLIKTYKWWSSTCMFIMWMEECGVEFPDEHEQTRLFKEIIHNLFNYGWK